MLDTYRCLKSTRVHVRCKLMMNGPRPFTSNLFRVYRIFLTSCNGYSKKREVL